MFLRPPSDRASRSLPAGEGTLLEPGCWLTLAPGARIEIGAGCFLNRNVMIAAHESVTIGDHTMFANGCFVGDAEHRYEDPEKPITWQGFTTKGPPKIGANAVVTRDIEDGTIAAGCQRSRSGG